MNTISNPLPRERLQAMDAAHHLHPFTDGDALNSKGARIVTGANGVMIRDIDGNEFLDGMAGLWCVNIGYGRNELADIAARQMRELPYYNTFFQTSHVPAIELSAKLARLAPEGDQSRLFRRFWIRSKRYEHSSCTPLLGGKKPTQQKHYYRSKKWLSRLHHWWGQFGRHVVNA